MVRRLKNAVLALLQYGSMGDASEEASASGRIRRACRLWFAEKSKIRDAAVVQRHLLRTKRLANEFLHSVAIVLGIELDKRHMSVRRLTSLIPLCATKHHHDEKPFVHDVFHHCKEATIGNIPHPECLTNRWEPQYVRSRASSRVARCVAFLGFMVLSLVMLVPVSAEEQTKLGFFSESEEGWFWYDDPDFAEPEENEKPSEQITVPSQPATPEGPKPLSAEWLRKQLPILLDDAIDDPSQGNVQAYFYAQRIMMDKAQVFSDMARQVVEADPLLDENLRVPFASAAKATVFRVAKDQKRSSMTGMKDQVGLWVFYDSRCPVCEQQVPTINKLAQDTELRITYFSKRSDPVPGLSPSIEVLDEGGRMKRLGITHTPAIMMVHPPDGYYLITQGFASLEQIQDRFINVAFRQGIMSEDEFHLANPMAKGVLRDSAQAMGETQIDWDDTDDWVPHLQRVIRTTYELGATEKSNDIQ